MAGVANRETQHLVAAAEKLRKKLLAKSRLSASVLICGRAAIFYAQD